MTNKTKVLLTFIIILTIILITVAYIYLFTSTQSPNNNGDIIGNSRTVIENLSDDELRVIFYNSEKYFINFAGISTDNGLAPVLSATSVDNAKQLIQAAYGYETIEYIDENELYYTFTYTSSNSSESDFLYVWKESVYYTNFGLTEELPEGFEDRDLSDKFPNPSPGIIKKVYDTIYDDSFSMSEHSTSKALASFIEETDTDFVYTLYRLTGNNAIKTEVEYLILETITYRFDKTTGIETSYSFGILREIIL